MRMSRPPPTPLFFFFNDTATTEIYTLSLHDALPIYQQDGDQGQGRLQTENLDATGELPANNKDRKSTRLNSSHGYISYAVFCLKKKKSRTALSAPETVPIMTAPLTSAHFYAQYTTLM